MLATGPEHMLVERKIMLKHKEEWRIGVESIRKVRQQTWKRLMYRSGSSYF